jgi:hypothetical protein
MPRIRSLRPNVSRDEALEEFSRGPLSAALSVIFGSLRSVADFYIPFQLFHVEISNRGKLDHRVFGLDAVSGSLDLYHFEQLPGASEIVYVETSNCVTVNLDEQRCRELLIGKLRRLIFSTGFFRVRDLRISPNPIPGEIYVPYWVGFRGRGMLARFTVLDAVRRKPEGAKVRQLLQSWLTSATEIRGDV